MKRFNFYKPFSPQLKPKLAYKEFKIICHEKNILLRLYILETELFAYTK